MKLASRVRDVLWYGVIMPGSIVQQTGATAIRKPAAADEQFTGSFRSGELADDQQARCSSNRQPPSGEHYRQRLPAPQGKVRLLMYFRPRGRRGGSASVAFRNQNQHLNIDLNAYGGMPVRGVTETVLSRGKVIIDHEKYLGNLGEGGS
jgi:hypothetical protein